MKAENNASSDSVSFKSAIPSANSKARRTNLASVGSAVKSTNKTKIINQYFKQLNFCRDKPCVRNASFGISPSPNNTCLVFKSKYLLIRRQHNSKLPIIKWNEILIIENN